MVRSTSPTITLVDNGRDVDIDFPGVRASWGRFQFP